MVDWNRIEVRLFKISLLKRITLTCEHCGSEIEAVELADFLKTALSQVRAHLHDELASRNVRAHVRVWQRILVKRAEL